MSQALSVPPAAGPSAEHAKEGMNGAVVSVVTQVLVDPEDPAFSNPTKPIGNFYTRKEVEEIAGVLPQHLHVPRVLQDRRQVGSGRGEPHGLQRGHLRRRHLEVVENRNLKKGDKVILGRSEKCEEGIYMHCNGFTAEGDEMDDQFVFRQGRSRETSYARDYDNLFELLRHEREHGNIVWVMGPAFSFDYAPARRCRHWLRTATPTA